MTACTPPRNPKTRTHPGCVRCIPPANNHSTALRLLSNHPVLVREPSWQAIMQWGLPKNPAAWSLGLQLATLSRREPPNCTAAPGCHTGNMLVPWARGLLQAVAAAAVTGLQLPQRHMKCFGGCPKLQPLTAARQRWCQTTSRPACPKPRSSRHAAHACLCCLDHGCSDAESGT